MSLIWVKGKPYRELTEEEIEELPLEALSGGPGRSAHPEFTRRIKDEWAECVVDGDPHPLKTIAERHGVDISTVSRWVRR